MNRNSRLFLLAAFVSVVSCSSASAAGPFGLFCKSHLGSSACDESPWAANGCDCGAERTCGCLIEQSCGCDRQDSCHCFAEDACDCYAEDAYDQYILETTPCDLVSCDAMACRPRCKPNRYCSMYGGWNKLKSYDGTITSDQLRGTFKDGWVVGFAGGRKLCCSLRAELEFALRTNTADHWSINGVSDNWSGHAYNWTAMTNMYYDITRVQAFGITPYVGGGIGVAVVDGDFTTNMTRIDVDDTVFAYQLISGLSKQLTESTQFFYEYRFLGTTDIDVSNIGVAPPVQVDGENIENDSLVFGFRIFK